jgi:hypothetical protein
MIIPNLVFRGMSADVVKYAWCECVDLVDPLVAEFISAIEFSLFALGLLCPVSPHAIHATIDDGAYLISTDSDGAEPIAEASTTLLPDMATPRPSATVSSWQWIT